MKDQALKLRELASERRLHQVGGVPNLVGLPTGPRTIAITSGKGGVGKTNLSINLALALAEKGRRVIVLDADLGLANINVALGLKVRTNLVDVVNGTRAIEEILVEGPGGIQIVPGGSGISELANINEHQRERLLSSFGRLSRMADMLLIDTAAGISTNVISFALLADTVLVVTVPEPPAIADAYGVIKALLKANPGLDLKLVVNRVLSPHEGRAVHDKLQLVVRRFLNGQLDPIGVLRDDALVGEAIRAQTPLLMEYPGAGVSQDIRDLATKLTHSSGTSGGLLTGFLDRLKRWFA